MNSENQNKKDNKIEKIIVKYEDGTEKELTNGAVISLTNDEDTKETTITCELTDFSYEDFTALFYGILEMGMKMGIFSDEEDEE